MRKPNCFILGAPKSGTSALAHYLSEHPNSFFCNPKEPFYWSEDYPRLRSRQGLNSLADYLDLFSAAEQEHRCIAEGSTNYLRSDVAIERILDFNPDAKFIAMLRNPIEVAHAFHAECLFAFIEREADFEKAWALQEPRSRGINIPPDCLAPQFLQYGNVASYPEQIDRLFRRVPSSQRKVILFDDFRSDNAGVFLDVQKFLGLPVVQPQQFARVNVAHGHRSKWVANLILDPPAVLKPAVEWLRNAMRSPDKNSWRAKLKAGFRKPQSRAPLSVEMKQRLSDFFREDIEVLSQQLDRDLSHWLVENKERATSTSPTPLPVSDKALAVGSLPKETAASALPLTN